MDRMAMQVSGTSSWTLKHMSTKEITRWKKDTYKVAAEAMRRKRLDSDFIPDSPTPLNEPKRLDPDHIY